MVQCTLEFPLACGIATGTPVRVGALHQSYEAYSASFLATTLLLKETAESHGGMVTNDAAGVILTSHLPGTFNL